ncbi:glycoside hydrolase family 13 protein [Pseudonocardia eucalypti]|uniref:Glycoside hydrolase family 13 protein n=1 Tax=Pseudonocardia eucalypti TaxID=648755 RepID=A0ABP9RE55_9PSEU|nr:alpha-glucosidase [Pseudonocardia eucalypti]
MQPSQVRWSAERPWWRDAVCYQIYLKSFADSNGDGVGDLDGIRARLGYLELLGVDALCLTPCFRSPMASVDADGYDVADPRDIDPLFGDLAAFDALVAASHEHGIRLVLDLVANHTSTQHEWFQAALGSGPGSPERDRYVFRYGRGPGDASPPNNWPSQTGGPAWTRIAERHGEMGQWYLHLFTPEEPDLNWSNPDVWTDLEKTLRFWLDRGVDGFRIDTAHGMAKPHGLPDAPSQSFGQVDGGDGPDARFDHDGVHEIHRMIRSVLDEYPARVLVGGIRVADDERFGRYLRPDELHLGENSGLLHVEFEAGEIKAAIERAVRTAGWVSGTPSWAISRSDVPRPVSRFGGGQQGLRRARALALVQLGLPGAAFLYNGEELGLPSVPPPDPDKQARNAHRVPLPWEGDEPPYGFSEGETSWLDMPDGWAGLTVEAQLEDAHSTLSLYRHALEIRRGHPGFVGDELEWFGAPAGCFAFRRTETTLACVLNTSEFAVDLPPGDVLISSGPLTEDGWLPPDTAVWLA